MQLVRGPADLPALPSPSSLNIAEASVEIRPTDASDLRAQAAAVLDHVRGLRWVPRDRDRRPERDDLVRRAARLREIASISTALHRLQLGVTGPVGRPGPEDRADLLAAQRSVADAQALTRDLLDELQPPDPPSRRVSRARLEAPRRA